MRPNQTVTMEPLPPCFAFGVGVGGGARLLPTALPQEVMSQMERQIWILSGVTITEKFLFCLKINRPNPQSDSLASVAVNTVAETVLHIHRIDFTEGEKQQKIHQAQEAAGLLQTCLNIFKWVISQNNTLFCANMPHSKHLLLTSASTLTDQTQRATVSLS